ncbi:MAG: hypothetical protein PWQ87_2 [Candidatus Woesearchaeota archaeon]|nr:hypothetical protein [Candidatus Woesearchaeota archaeon]
MRQKSKLNKSLRIAIIIICIFILLFIIPFFVPTLIQVIAGDTIINNHIKEVYTATSLLGHINNSFEWLNNTYIPYGEKRIFPLYGSKNGFYRVNNKTVMFIRPNTVSWFILTKTGNCGEHADYMFEIFKRMSYDVRKVHAVGGDHSIIQIVKENKSYFIDPSNRRILNQSTYFENGQWARIIAITVNGTELDLTNDILSNKTNVSLKKNTSQKVKVAIKSTYLMSNNGMYKKPILVYQFKSYNDSIIVSAGKKYIVEYYRDFIFIKFSIEEDIDLSRDTRIYSKNVPISFKNLRITITGYIFLLIVCMIILYSYSKVLIKKLKDFFSH